MTPFYIRAIADYDAEDNPKIARVICAVYPLPVDNELIIDLGKVLMAAAAGFLESRLVTPPEMPIPEPLSPTVH